MPTGKMGRSIIYVYIDSAPWSKYLTLSVENVPEHTTCWEKYWFTIENEGPDINNHNHANIHGTVTNIVCISLWNHTHMKEVPYSKMKTG